MPKCPRYDSIWKLKFLTIREIRNVSGNARLAIQTFACVGPILFSCNTTTFKIQARFGIMIVNWFRYRFFLFILSKIMKRYKVEIEKIVLVSGHVTYVIKIYFHDFELKFYLSKYIRVSQHAPLIHIQKQFLYKDPPSCKSYKLMTPRKRTYLGLLFCITLFAPNSVHPFF